MVELLDGNKPAGSDGGRRSEYRSQSGSLNRLHTVLESFPGVPLLSTSLPTPREICFSSMSPLIGLLSPFCRLIFAPPPLTHDLPLPLLPIVHKSKIQWTGKRLSPCGPARGGLMNSSGLNPGLMKGLSPSCTLLFCFLFCL